MGELAIEFHTGNALVAVLEEMKKNENVDVAYFPYTLVEDVTTTLFDIPGVFFYHFELVDISNIELILDFFEDQNVPFHAIYIENNEPKERWNKPSKFFMESYNFRVKCSIEVPK